MIKTILWCGTGLLFIVLITGGPVLGPAADRPSEGDQASVSPGLTLVMPFVDMTEVFKGESSVRSPVTAKMFVTGTVEPRSALYLTNELHRMLRDEPSYIWDAVQKMDEVVLFDASDLRTSHILKLQALGRRHGAGSVMAGYLYAFRDRQGGDYGVEKPAQVAFELVQVDSVSGRIVWQRSYKETQKPLSDDLFKLKTFIKRKGRWLSAREMASAALKELLESVPHKRRYNP